MLVFIAMKSNSNNFKSNQTKPNQTKSNSNIFIILYNLKKL
jgi:hypothetical protein